ncbi:MAG: T9SS type A sorting domain-containing protein [Saprospiraceae bacterium]|nr:T9SS type A sorting domain-containing protein [Saprospiraceae bacterium]
MPPFDDFDGALVGSLNFFSPYYPIVGSQNVSTYYSDLTSYWADPNVNRTHSLILLPDAAGNPPVLTVDVPLFILGNFLGFNTIRGGELIMSPGAQVKVLSGDTLAMGYIKMFTCTNMVCKGIVAEPNARLALEGCEFADAELAIDLKKGSWIETYGLMRFLNNYKSIRIDNTGSAVVPDIQAYFGTFSHQFLNNRPLKSPYPGMPAPKTTKGYGMEILNHPNIDLFRAVFLNLNNGVRLFRSGFSTQAFFDTIVPDANATDLHQGKAIWGFGIGTEALTLITTGINNSHFGIFTHRMNVSVNESFIQAFTGMSVSNSRLKNITVTNCTTGFSGRFACRDLGLRTFASLPLGPGSKIENNLFQIGGAGATNGTGILMNEGGQVQTKNAIGWNVTNNDINLGDGSRRGIQGIGVNKSLFRSNDILVLNNNADLTGIDLQSSREIVANCNDVIANFANPGRGYRFAAMSESNYTCNTTDRLSKGMEFSILCEGTTLKGSEFRNTTTGLNLKADVMLGLQGVDGANLVQDHGNKWVASAAVHEAALQTIVNGSRFGVDPIENPNFKPQSNWPNWFVDELTPNNTSFLCAGFPCVTPGPVPEKDRSVEKSVANGSIHTVGLPGVLPIMLENHLYAALQQNPAWASGDPLYQQFLLSKNGSNTQAFWQLRQGMEMLYNRTDTEQDAVSATENNIRTLRRELFLMDSLFALSGVVNKTLHAQKLANLSTEIASLEAQLSNIRNNRLILAAQLLTQNAAIGATQTWAQNEKLVNDIEIRLFMQDSATNAQLATLDALGSLCPHTNGDAVFQAQTLYNWFVVKEFNPVCTGGRGEGRTEPKANEIALLVYPNPSTGRVIIPNPLSAQRLVEVFDLSGKSVFRLETNETDFDLTHLANGVFLVRVQELSGGNIQSVKLVLNR